MEIQDDDNDLNKLTSIGGYKVSLCEDVQDTLLCPFCKLLMRNPVQTFRGELACEYCYVQAQNKQDVSSNSKCPIDGEPIEPNQVFRDKYKTREILQLRCCCSNKNSGCKWQGTLSLANEHERGCKYKLVNCYMCNKKEIQLSDVNSHLEVCSVLRTEGTCIYPGCVYNIKSTADLQHHLATDVIVHSILTTSTISNIREHVSIQLELHTKTQKERGQRLQMQVKDLQQQITAMKNNMLPLQTKYEETIAALQQTVAGLEKRLISSEKLLSANNFTTTPATKTDNNNNNNNNNLSTSIELLNQNISDLNLRQQLYENTSYNGRLVWKIDGIAKRLDNAITGKITALHSAPTFTDVYGYKFCGRLYLNGDGVGRCTHVSLFFVLMKSEYDNLLMWPFRKGVRMRLINQVDGENDIIESFVSNVNSSSFMKPKKDMNIASGCPLFIEKEKFLNDGFIKDDTIFIDLSVYNVTTTSSK